MTRRAIRVSKDTVERIINLNYGTHPGQEAMDIPTMFIYSDDDPEVQNHLMTYEVFNKQLQFIDHDENSTDDRIEDKI